MSIIQLLSAWLGVYRYTSRVDVESWVYAIALNLYPTLTLLPNLYLLEQIDLFPYTTWLDE